MYNLQHSFKQKSDAVVKSSRMSHASYVMAAGN